MYKMPIYLFLVLSVFCIQSCNNNGSETRKIVIYGTAEKEVQPDKMDWLVTVNNKNDSLDVVAEEHNKIVTQIINFLKANAAEKIQTSGMQFGENWLYRNQSQIKEGYFALSNISFTITNLNKYKDIWIGLSKFSDIQIERILFDNTAKIDIQNEVRNMALIKAKEKAESMANTLSMALGKPVTIIEDQTINNNVREKYLSNQLYTDNNMISQNTSDEIIAPGKIKIAMRVKVEFELNTR